MLLLVCCTKKEELIGEAQATQEVLFNDCSALPLVPGTVSNGDEIDIVQAILDTYHAQGFYHVNQQTLNPITDYELASLTFNQIGMMVKGRVITLYS